MAVQTSAGSSLGLSATLPATYDATGFNALTFTTIGEVTDIAEFGRAYQVTKHLPLATRTAKKFKGSYDNGSIQVKMGRDTSNAGQTLMKTALTSDASYAVKITLQDASKIYFTGKITDYKVSVGNADQLTGASTTIEIDNDILEV